jgi:hypothetical protein
MRADPEEYVIPDSQRDRFPFIELLLAVAVIAGLVFFWFWSDEKKPVEAVVEVPPIAVPADQTNLPPTPDIPQRPETAAVVVPDPAALVSDDGTMIEQTKPVDVTTLSPADGDELLRRELAEAGADANLNKLVSKEQPLEVSAALIDGLGRGLILRKLLPAGPSGEAFSVVRENDVVSMSSASYERYDSYTDSITSLDSSQLVDAFHTLRPLYERAYEHLGLDPGDFDNALIRALDLVLATPEIDEPILLKPKSVVYIYADPALESLPAVQKQLLRAGPDNIRRLKQQARTLRDGLLAQ